MPQENRMCVFFWKVKVTFPRTILHLVWQWIQTLACAAACFAAADAAFAAATALRPIAPDVQMEQWSIWAVMPCQQLSWQWATNEKKSLLWSCLSACINSLTNTSAKHITRQVLRVLSWKTHWICLRGRHDFDADWLQIKNRSLCMFEVAETPKPMMFHGNTSNQFSQSNPGIRGCCTILPKS